MGIIAIIPARFASTRFPGKLLAKKTGKYLIQHVYEQVCQAQSLESVLIATDDPRIACACDEFDAPREMTRSDHQSGTDRIAEVAKSLRADIIVNVQGDEPEIDPKNIDRVAELLKNDIYADLATLSAKFNKGEDLSDPNIVKVVTNQKNHALYFSRHSIPFIRDASNNNIHRKHIGIYAYRREMLLRLSQMPPTPLEQAEKLEQLRALENDMVIAVADVEHHAVGIDTPEQYEEFVKRMQKT
ncbi:MAG: 3-deoxy-manno-octulosonate cytidylyltransferase [Planctomycetes bacterium]|nr:3-deoxy-manno-octulosonate cytidylyltransferase [Planctomycetota bacterium]